MIDGVDSGSIRRERSGAIRPADCFARYEPQRNTFLLHRNIQTQHNKSQSSILAISTELTSTERWAFQNQRCHFSLWAAGTSTAAVQDIPRSSHSHICCCSNSEMSPFSITGLNSECDTLLMLSSRSHDNTYRRLCFCMTLIHSIVVIPKPPLPPCNLPAWHE